FSDMDIREESDDAFPKMKFRSGVRLCTLCESPGPVLFKIPSDENRQKKWFSALKWNVPPEKLKYVLDNARLCNRHFSESCFSSTLQRRLNKFACPQISDLPSSASEKLFTLPSSASACSEIDNMSDLPSPASQYPSVEVDTEPSCSRNIDSSPEESCINSNGYLQVTPKTRKIKTLLSNVSKLKKRLYENRSASRLLGQLQAKLAEKPYLYQFIHSQIRMIKCRSSKGRRWSAKEKSFALQIYLHSPSAYRILRKYFAFPSKATLHRYTYNVAKTPGFCPNLIKCLKIQSARMSESEKLCVLTIDEMSMKPGYRYAADLDCVDGFTSFQEDCKGRPPYATLALVFMARGIVKNWKQVIINCYLNFKYFTSKYIQICYCNSQIRYVLFESD
ncbi:unnamed protein product, partial [Larinioides sclopetarius]